MKVIDVQTREVFVILEISAGDLRRLKTMLDCASIEYDGGDPEQKAAHEYFTSEFYPKLEKIVKKLFPAEETRQDGD